MDHDGCAHGSRVSVAIQAPSIAVMSATTNDFPVRVVLRGFALATVVLIGCGAPPPNPRASDAGANGVELVVLGVAQDGGVPHLGCERVCCAAARLRGEHLYPASLGLRAADGRLLLVEATPAIDAQVALLHRTFGVSGRGRRPVDAILLTHAHIGHYLGLAQLGREVAGAPGVEVWVSPRFARFLRENGPWSQLVQLGQIVLREFAPGARFSPLPGIEVTALPVPHRDEYSDTMAYVLHGPRRSALFVPDIDRWENASSVFRAALQAADVAFLDGTFFDGSELPGRDLDEIPHPPMVRTMEWLADRAAAAPGALRFLHFNHTNPVLRDAQAASAVRALGFALAQRGDTVTL